MVFNEKPLPLFFLEIFFNTKLIKMARKILPITVPTILLISIFGVVVLFRGIFRDTFMLNLFLSRFPIVSNLKLKIN